VAQGLGVQLTNGRNLRDDPVALCVGAERPYRGCIGVVPVGTRSPQLYPSVVRSQQDASAKALVRPLLEAGLRTLWISEVASGQTICALAEGRKAKVPPTLGALDRCLSNCSDISLNKRFLGALDIFTHGGIRAITAQFAEGEELERSNAADWLCSRCWRLSVSSITRPARYSDPISRRYSDSWLALLFSLAYLVREMKLARSPHRRLPDRFSL
jgi:hypothetical protein